MPDKNPVPHLKYRSKDPANKHLGVVEIDEAEKYWIDDLEHFYEAFGYSNDMRKWGVLPDEFIWQEYLSDSANGSSTCFQLHLIEYLIKHSSSFLKMHENQYNDWIAALAEARSASGKDCCACNARRSIKYSS